ncbi:MAG: TRAP transporter large permease [Ichthyobacteriaceae bacterium]|nr:TRAP transporter large permease [Ichthyobacteriaceae bacterium]
MESLSVLILVVSFLSLLLVGVPVAYSIGVSAVLTLISTVAPLPAFTTIAQRMATGLDSFSLLAIPMFVLAGQIMNKGGIAFRLIEFAKILVGRLPGGLLFVNVIANMLFGSISGSAIASASAIGGFMGPMMKKEGYDEKLSASVNITSSVTGLLIPPSNVLIVYSLASGGVSIGALFMAGYLPGIMLGVGLMAVAGFYAKKNNYPVLPSITLKQAMRVTLNALPSLSLLVVIIGGIVSGIFTATEASAIAVVYALALTFIYKELTPKQIPTILLDAVKTTSIVVLLVGASMGMSWVMSYVNIPQTVSDMLLSVSDNKIIVLLLINFILLFVGTFMDITPAVLIFTPIFLPVVTALGVDPVHFGIILILNLSIGLVTPPVGTVLFVGASIAKVKIEDIFKSMLPLYFAMIIILLIVTYSEDVVMFVPRLLGM